MHTQTMTGAQPLVRPMGDDWLTRDPESFDDAVGVDLKDIVTQDLPGCGRWRRVREDLMLYAAGITTGLAVVAAVLLLLTVFDSPGVAVKPPVEEVNVVGAPVPLASR